MPFSAIGSLRTSTYGCFPAFQPHIVIDWTAGSLFPQHDNQQHESITFIYHDSSSKPFTHGDMPDRKQREFSISLSCCCHRAVCVWLCSMSLYKSGCVPWLEKQKKSSKVKNETRCSGTQPRYQTQLSNFNKSTTVAVCVTQAAVSH